MKYILLLFIYPCFAVAGFKEVISNDLYQYKKRTIKKFTKKKYKRIRKNNSIEATLSQLMEEDRKISEILKKRENTLIVRTSNNKIIALTRLRGIVLNSILAMNIKPSKFIVRLSDDNSELENAEIRCIGHSFQRRVPAHCNLLVLDDQEFKVDIDIWDLDGAEGIIADYFYSGEEKAFLTSSFASFLEGVLDTAKDKIMTPFGNSVTNNPKNKILGGLMGVANNTKSMIASSGEKELSVSYINSGKEVLVFFNQTLNLNKEINK